MALLFDRGGFGIALDHDEAAQHGAIFAGHFLPCRLAIMLATRDGAALDLRREQDAPAILRHPHIIEFRPALGIDADGGAQIDEALLEAIRPKVVPPGEITRMPFLQRLEDTLVAGK